jgi:hypothetical protein
MEHGTVIALVNNLTVLEEVHCFHMLTKLNTVVYLNTTGLIDLSLLKQVLEKNVTASNFGDRFTRCLDGLLVVMNNSIYGSCSGRLVRVSE